MNSKDNTLNPFKDLPNIVDNTLLNQNIPTIIANFEVFLEKIIQQTWATRSEDKYLEALAKNSGYITTYLIEIGDRCFDELEPLPEKTRGSADYFPFYQILFLWTDRAKSFLILWRNILFEAQKARILLLEDKISELDFRNLKIQSKATVKTAADDLNAYLEETEKQVSRRKNGVKKQIASWILQQNPYPTYKSQLELLAKQCNDLVVQNKELRAVLDIFNQIENIINDSLELSNHKINGIQQISNRARVFLNENAELKPGKIGALLEDPELALTSSVSLEYSINRIEEILPLLNKKLQVSIDVKEGLIQFKEINFQRNVRQWLESEVYPVLYEIWELTDNATTSQKTTFLNIHNRLNILADSKEAVDINQISLPLNQHLKKFRKIEETLSVLKQSIDQKLEKSFGVFLIYDAHHNFLPFQLQATINQFRSQQSAWLDRSQGWLKNQLDNIDKVRRSVQREEALSVSEKVVRFIQSRTIETGDDFNYSNIILSKGYAGESFCVGRLNEFQHIENLILQWKQGFRGAVILSGQRFAGKTLFGEVVANRFFPKNCIRLVPNTAVKVLSRSLQSSYDLGHSLNFIRKYTLQDKVMIWIDDIELWSDQNHPLSGNIRKLCQFIDDFSGQVFIMVSMSNWAKNYFDKVHEIHKKFQTEINLDKMALEEVREAILLRHGATHKELVDASGEEAFSKSFQKASTRTFKEAEGNIGEALRLWSLSIRMFDEEKVVFQNRNHHLLPDFLNPDTAILLTTLITEKRSNEYRLSKVFGPPFQGKYRNILQRLINIGVLTRHEDDWLEINEAVVNEVAKLLDRKQYLKFHAKV